MVIHGIGNQQTFSPLRNFAIMSGAVFQESTNQSRAALLNDAHKSSGVIQVAGPNSFAAEINYADLLDQSLPYAESNPISWLRNLKYQIDHLTRNRECPPMRLDGFERVISDIVSGSRIATFLAERFKVGFSGSVATTVARLMQQIQLYAEYDEYREAIDRRFNERIAAIADSMPAGVTRLTLFAHSLGSVVTLRSLIRAHSRNANWLSKLDRLVTFGSPIDLFMTCYPTLFRLVPVADNATVIRSVQWSNYRFPEDPIASDIAVGRYWGRTQWAGLFAPFDPVEYELRGGSIATAHTDYWSCRHMFTTVLRPKVDIQSRVTRSDRSDRRRGPMYWAHHALALASGMLFLVWWEENLKSDDAERVTLSDWARQLCCMVLAYGMAYSSSRVHGSIGTASPNDRLQILSLAMSFPILTVMLPGLYLLGFDWHYHIGLRHSPFQINLYWGNIVVALVLAISFIFSGRLLNRDRSGSTLRSAVILLVCAVVLTLCVGTRTNVSNFIEELDTILLIAGTWWLASIASRIDWVWDRIVGGRIHLDALGNHWGVIRSLRNSKAISSTGMNDQDDERPVVVAPGVPVSDS